MIGRRAFVWERHETLFDDGLGSANCNFTSFDPDSL